MDRRRSFIRLTKIKRRGKPSYVVAALQCIGNPKDVAGYEGDPESCATDDSSHAGKVPQGHVYVGGRDDSSVVLFGASSVTNETLRQQVSSAVLP